MKTERTSRMQCNLSAALAHYEIRLIPRLQIQPRVERGGIASIAQLESGPFARQLHITGNFTLIDEKELGIGVELEFAHERVIETITTKRT